MKDTHNCCNRFRNVLPLHSEIRNNSKAPSGEAERGSIIKFNTMKTQNSSIQTDAVVHEGLHTDANGIMLFSDPTPAYSLDMRLSKHFTLREFVRSATAIRHGINNMPGEEEIERMRQLCVNVLEPLRERFGVIRITSGFRSFQVNEYVGGTRTSQHLTGEAADIHVGNTEVGRKMYDFIFQNLVFDQMLLEVKGERRVIHCLHISYRSDRGENRKQCKMEYRMSN